MDAPDGVGTSVPKFRFRIFEGVGANILVSSSLETSKVGRLTNEIMVEVFAVGANL